MTLDNEPPLQSISKLRQKSEKIALAPINIADIQLWNEKMNKVCNEVLEVNDAIQTLDWSEDGDNELSRIKVSLDYLFN